MEILFKVRKLLTISCPGKDLFAKDYFSPASLSQVKPQAVRNLIYTLTILGAFYLINDSRERKGIEGIERWEIIFNKGPWSDAQIDDWCSNPQASPFFAC